MLKLSQQLKDIEKLKTKIRFDQRTVNDILDQTLEETLKVSPKKTAQILARKEKIILERIKDLETKFAKLSNIDKWKCMSSNVSNRNNTVTWSYMEPFFMHINCDSMRLSNSKNKVQELLQKLEPYEYNHRRLAIGSYSGFIDPRTNDYFEVKTEKHLKEAVAYLLSYFIEDYNKNYA